MVTKLLAFILLGSLLADVPEWRCGGASAQQTTAARVLGSGEPSSADALPASRSACVGCMLTDTGSLCTNCTVSMSWGQGSEAGTCKQVANCGPTEKKCKFGAFTVTVTATAPGCEIRWWNGGPGSYDNPFRLNSGSVSHDYGDGANPLLVDCGIAYSYVMCGSTNPSFGGPKCGGCTEVP